MQDNCIYISCTVKNPLKVLSSPPQQDKEGVHEYAHRGCNGSFGPAERTSKINYSYGARLPTSRQQKGHLGHPHQWLPHPHPHLR